MLLTYNDLEPHLTKTALDVYSDSDLMVYTDDYGTLTVEISDNVVGHGWTFSDLNYFLLTVLRRGTK